MYMLLDVNSPLVGESLTSWNPWESYYDTYLNRTFAVVEAFKDYPNTLAFFSGNEVINDLPSGKTVPPYMRAVTRDLRNYVKKHASRPIPVGYSAADVREILFDSYNYFQCSIEAEDDNMSMADLFALNSYSWCGDSSFEKAGYNALVSGFKGASVPIFFSEYGCNAVTPRVFTEVGTIYGSEMDEVFSGGVVYEYTQEPNNYGLVDLHEDGTAQLRSDFVALQEQYSKLDFAAIQSQKPPAGDAPNPPVCSADLITNEGFANTFKLPEMPPGVAEIIEAGVSPKPSGKLVDIADWNVKFEVRNPDGSVITNLAVKPLPDDAVNGKPCPDIHSTHHTQSKNASSISRPLTNMLPLLLAPGTNTDAGVKAGDSTSEGESTSEGASSGGDSKADEKSAAPRAAAMVLPAVAMGLFATMAGIAM